MRAASAWRDVTPDRPIYLAGQMHARLGEYARDPLTVNAAVFEDGQEKVAIVSADVCIIPDQIADELRRSIAQAVGIQEHNILLSATHTHVAPFLEDLGLDGAPIDEQWVSFFKQSIIDAVSEANANLIEVKLWSGNGYIEQMGWNRRGLHRDGFCEMYLGSWRPGFKGIEGPRDGHVGVIWATDESHNVTLVVSSFSTHPNCLEQGKFYSADIPGEVRKVIRGGLGQQVGVIYLTGAAGDTAPSIMVDNEKNVQPWRGEEGVKRSGRYLGGEILKTIASTTTPMESPVIRSAHRPLMLQMRPWDKNFNPDLLPEGGMKQFCVRSREMWDTLMREKNPFPSPVHVIRLGDAVLCSNSAELFCEFGLAIKKHSPAKTTLIAQLTNGWCGYIPTPHAIGHGGYSARSSSHTRAVPDAGWQIVDDTVEMLKEVF